MATKIIMPKLGESVVEGTVVKWLKQEGELVEEFESLMEVESAKVNTEIPSPAEGTLLKILVQAGETVDADTVLAWIGDAGEEINVGETSEKSKSEPAPIEETQESSPASERSEYQSGRNRDLGFISPVVAKIAGDNHVNLNLINGTGQGGRITKKDVLNYLEDQKASPSAEEPQAWETPGEGDLFRPTELQFPERYASKVSKSSVSDAAQKPAITSAGRLVPHTKIRKQIAEHMRMSKQTSPHVTTVMEANMHHISIHREKNKGKFLQQGANLTFTAYFISAIAQSLLKYPMVNSSWTNEGILIKNEINLGMAVSLGEEGLIVPVIKNAESLSLLGIAKQVNSLGERARQHQLTPDDVMGGTFTLTNHGTAGSLFATPIINQPQCGILGVGLIQKRVVVIEDTIAIRPMVYLSLSFDHRILDGSSADGFLGEVVRILENWQ